MAKDNLNYDQDTTDHRSGLGHYFAHGPKKIWHFECPLFVSNDDYPFVAGNSLNKPYTYKNIWLYIYIWHKMAQINHICIKIYGTLYTFFFLNALQS